MLQSLMSGYLTNKKFSPTTLFLIPTFFYFISERALSYTFPIITEHVVNSNFIVGIILSISSLVSLACDVFLPQILKSRTWKIQTIVGSIACMFFPILIFTGEKFNSIFLLIMASFFWALSYEVFSFAQQNFITEEEDKSNYSRAWGMTFVITQLVSIASILYGPTLLDMDQGLMCIIILTLQSFGLFSSIIISSRFKKKKLHQITEIAFTETHHKKIAISKEFKYWFIYAQRIPSIIIVGFWVGLIDAAFWTFAGLLGESLDLPSSAEALILVLYIIPTLLGAVVLSRIKVPSHKKLFSQIALILSGIFLSLISFHFLSPYVLFVLIFLFGFAFSFTKPLNDAVYSDLLERSDSESQQHLVGLAKANDTFSYLIGPIIIGWFIDRGSYVMVFAGLGVLTSLIAIFLLITTPKKLKIPQVSLHNLEVTN